MKNFAAAVSLALFAVSWGALFADEKSEPRASGSEVEGIVFFHTFRKPMSVEDLFTLKPDPERKDGLVFGSKGFCAKTGGGETAQLVFSNKLAVSMEQNSEFSVEKFSMSKDDVDVKYTDTSRLELKSGRGVFFFHHPDSATVVTFSVSTPFGKFDIKSPRAKLEVGDRQAKLSLVEGSANFIPKEGKSEEFIGKENSITCFERGKASVESMTLPAMDAINKGAIPAKVAQRSVIFYLGNDGKLHAKRVSAADIIKDRKN